MAAPSGDRYVSLNRSHSFVERSGPPLVATGAGKL